MQPFRCSLLLFLVIITTVDKVFGEEYYVNTAGDCVSVKNKYIVPVHDCIEEIGMLMYLKLQDKRDDNALVNHHTKPPRLMDGVDCVFGDVIQSKEECIQHLEMDGYLERLKKQKEIDAKQS